MARLQADLEEWLKDTTDNSGSVSVRYVAGVRYFSAVVDQTLNPTPELRASGHLAWAVVNESRRVAPVQIKATLQGRLVEFRGAPAHEVSLGDFEVGIRSSVREWRHGEKLYPSRIWHQEVHPVRTGQENLLTKVDQTHLQSIFNVFASNTAATAASVGASDEPSPRDEETPSSAPAVLKGRDEDRASPHMAILTIRDDEFMAVLDRLEDVRPDKRKHRTYRIGSIPRSDGHRAKVAVVRLVEQGTGYAADTTRDAIEDLDPGWIGLVGIGGAVPESEFCLGDVIVASRLHDFTVGAYIEGEDVEFAARGGPMAKPVQDLLGDLPALSTRELRGWEAESAIGRPLPRVTFKDKNFYGDESWIKKTKRAVVERFDTPAPRQPISTARPIASDGYLIKDPSVIQEWKRSARDLAAVEMELPGVFVSSQRMQRSYPILAVRGISDIVGFRREPEWTSFACHSAASFVTKLLSVVPLDLFE